jgi:hypothetical protein
MIIQYEKTVFPEITQFFQNNPIFFLKTGIFL